MSPSTRTVAHAPLPPPSADEQALSDRLAALIRAEIAAAGGAIPFHRYMHLALYAPGLGYYAAGKTKFGAAGDFVTAPELGPLFARTLARALQPVLAGCATPEILELGGGSGALAVDLILALAEQGAAPRRYRILEPSAELRQRQRERVAAALPAELAARVEWLDGLPDADWEGALIANEVIDALPASRFAVRDGEIVEACVAAAADGRFGWIEQPADALLAGAVRHTERRLGAPLPEGYVSETLPQLPAWLDAVTASLARGVALFVDYGYPRREYYLAERSDGTLRGFYRQRVHGDPFFAVGLSDLTASVDFSWLAECGAHCGFAIACYATQAEFLLAAGIDAEMARLPELPPLAQLALSNQAKRLLLPGEMGERFGVLALARDLDPASLPWSSADRSGRL
jgi:SAM-dependent MidA family methyltransferase